VRWLRARARTRVRVLVLKRRLGDLAKALALRPARAGSAVV